MLYSLITILWKFRIENPMFTPIFMISHVKKVSISRPIKFYVCSHKNGYKHRIFDPKLSQYCFLTIIKMLWKYQMKNPMFAPTFMTAHVKSWNWPKFQTSFFLRTNHLRLTKVLRITPPTLRYQKTGVFTAIFRFFYRPH